jgi:hypothetical protein
MMLDLLTPPADRKHAVLHPCPSCGGECDLAAGALVYPTSDSWHERMALVCWSCWVVRRRGEAWAKIDRARHNRQWENVRCEYAADDNGGGRRRRRKGRR